MQIQKKTNKIPLEKESQDILGHKEIKIQTMQQKQEKILKVASELFLKYGYQKTNLQMIIQQTGGSFATIYKFFETKENLFEKVIESNQKEFVKTLNEIFVQSIDSNLNIEKYFYNIGLCLVYEILKGNNIAWMRLMIIEAYNNPNLVKIFNSSANEIHYFFTQGIEYYNNKYNLEIQKNKIEEYSRLLVRLIIEPYFLFPLLDSNYKPPKREEIKSNLKTAIKIFILYLKNNKENQ
ncbi:TetR/AcrR family transcriptional regulator [uncultured Helicobacter sp.]|uniref:TetR/AcrR family transcriptional regulator n=1 Tax=uncultured Helicobacter sp. TaxID=175537 RepID=UPI0026126E02|nr:TetR/AcrR family transcriptional regulator [uncultured Helicobacter sp.]